MRFLFKRPRLRDVREDINLLLEVMVSDTLVYFDLFLFSLLFAVMIFPVSQSALVSILAFPAFYCFFFCLYQCGKSIKRNH